MGKRTETLRPPFQNLKVRVNRVQQESQRPRAAVGSDPENEITEKKDYNQREETGRRWAYEKLEPWSEWIPGDTQNVNSIDILPKTYAAQCSTLFGNPFYRISIPMCLPHMPTDASFAANWLMRCDRLFQIRLHLTFQSVQRGKTDGDAASPFPKSQSESQPRATRIPTTKGRRRE